MIHMAEKTPQRGGPRGPQKRRRDNRRSRPREKKEFNVEAWTPKTALGKRVKSGEIKDIKQVFEEGTKILEPEIVDALIPNLETDLLLVGQSKGKFGGGQRRVFKQTQKKTMEGNKPKFSAFAVVGNRDGIVGIGIGKAKETVPAREKAFRNAKLNIIMIRRGAGSWEDKSTEPHSIPYKVEGKCGSVSVKLMPAPKGKGLVIEKECSKIMRLAGIKDVWAKSYGSTGTKANLIMAYMKAMQKLITTKIHPNHIESLGIVDGPTGKVAYKTQEEIDAEKAAPVAEVVTGEASSEAPEEKKEEAKASE
jgi:small subunit ribosomal protein S5